MAAPTPPNLATLVAEGFKKAGITSPVAALTTRAQDYWIEEVKNDILVLSGGRKLKSLYTTSCAPTVNGKDRYACPPDYFSDLTVEILDGTKRGTATAGASGSITLADNEGDIVGSSIFILSGTGVGSMSQCTAFNTSTFVATISPNFTTAPGNGSGYLIVDRNIVLGERHQKHASHNGSGIPIEFYPTGSPTYGEFTLFPTPYNSDGDLYGILMRYYANLMTSDLAGTLMATLYQRWRNVWNQKILVEVLKEKHDSNSELEAKRYQFMIQQLVARETYGMDMSNLTARIVDY